MSASDDANAAAAGADAGAPGAPGAAGAAAPIARTFQSFLDQHMKQNHVYEDLRNTLQRFLVEHRLTETQKVELLAQLHAQTRPLSSSSTSSSTAAVSTSPPLVTAMQRLKPGHRYLRVHVKHGHSFIDEYDGEDSSKSSSSSSSSAFFSMHVQFRSHRQSSPLFPACADPQFQHSFFLPLRNIEHGDHDNNGVTDDDDDDDDDFGHHSSASHAHPPMPTMDSLMHLSDQVHLVLVREDRRGNVQFLAAHELEWRRTLVHGRLDVTVQLVRKLDAQHNVGVLELLLEVVPLKRPPKPNELPVYVESSTLDKHLKQERTVRSGIDQRFHAYAKAWWHDYNATRPLHANRLIKIMALDEQMVERCVCTFVTPMYARRCLDSPVHAARFVRLIPFRKNIKLGGARFEVWHSPHVVLSQRYGDLEDHCVLLCSLLLGFGLNAYVCVGTTDAGVHTWVVTIGANARVTCWESVSGQRFELPATPDAATAAAPVDTLTTAWPYRQVFCLFNHRNFYANNQLEDAVHAIHWRLDNATHWKCMHEQALSTLPRRKAFALRAPSVLPVHEEQHLESSLRQIIRKYRTEFARLSTTFDASFSYVLGPALAAYESERVTGVCFGNQEFQDAVKHMVPLNHIFKAVPFQFTVLDPSVILSTMLSNRACSEILHADTANLTFGLRVKVYAYPEDMLVVWLVLACMQDSLSSTWALQAAQEAAQAAQAAAAAAAARART